MIDSSDIAGVAIFLGAFAAGGGIIAFVENQGERTMERGGMSEETKTRMAGMFMEDEELVSDVSDTISKMEAALAKAEGREVDEGDGLTEERKKELKDDWETSTW